MIEDPTETISSRTRSTAEDARLSYLVVVFEGTPLLPPRLLLLSRESIVLGRSELDGEVVVLNDPAVSKRHLLLRVSAEAEAEDLSSKNGTWVNGQRLRGRTRLQSGDVIRCGNTLLVARSGPRPSLEELDDPELPGLAPDMRAAREGIHRVASGTAPVLILGETGTGKELAARAIHRLSRRKGRFCATNAAELQAGLAASELFGRVKGAYTDAEASEGLVGAAEDGTLFLDEMGDLPKDVQPALLRLLESGHYRPVGSDAEVLGRARVVAATNVDLEAAVRAGRFRRDLLGRLRGYVEPITLPPLRQRPEDLVTWAQRFGGPEALREWSARDVERLLLHPWLEGLRELRRVCAGGPAALDSLPSGASSPSGEELTPEPSDAAAAGPLPDRAALIRALQETSGNVLAASRALHIHRRRLYRLIEEEGLDLQDFRAPEK